MTHNESAWDLIRISSIYLTSSRDNMQQSRRRLFNINIQYCESVSMTTTKTKKVLICHRKFQDWTQKSTAVTKYKEIHVTFSSSLIRGISRIMNRVTNIQHTTHYMGSRDKKSLTLTLQVISFWCTRFLIQETIDIVVQKSRIAHDIVDINNVISSTVKALAVALRCNIERRFEQNQGDAVKTRQFSFNKSPHRADLFLVDCFPINVTFHIRYVLQFLLLVFFSG